MGGRKRVRHPISRLSKRGFRGYPAATVAFYGPSDQLASKVAVGIVPAENAEVIDLERWVLEDRDIRTDILIGKEVVQFIEQHGARTVFTTDRIIGCPHEEGIDYPEGEVCPACPFWQGRDRWTGDAHPPTQ